MIVRIPKRGHGPLISPEAYRVVAQGIVYPAGAYGLIQGGLILTADIMRWSSPSYARALTVPGAPDSWGWFAAGSGLVVLLGCLVRKPFLIGIGMAVLALWSGFFAVQFALAAYDSPRAGITAPAIYMWAFLVQMAAATCYVYPTLERVAAWVEKRRQGAAATREG